MLYICVYLGRALEELLAGREEARLYCDVGAILSRIVYHDD